MDCSDISDEDKQKIAGSVRYHTFNSNDIIYSQGDNPTNMYIVIYGSVEETVYDVSDGDNSMEPAKPKPDPSTWKAAEVSNLVSGQIFGEVAVLTDTAYTSSVTAKGLSAIILLIPLT
jgi:CRP-like cAMP-binding protein